MQLSRIDRDFIIDPRLAGLSGDMLLSALAALGKESGRLAFNTFAKKVLKEFNLQRTTFEIREATVNGFAGYQVHQNFQDDLVKRNFTAIRGYFQQIFALDELSERAISFCNDTLALLISAEAQVHGKNERDETGHFHELGSADTIIDICGVAFLIDHLNAWNCQFITLPLNTGSGKVKIDHGIVSVPAPAVVEILTRHELPFFSDGTPAELVTPTGVALLAKLVSKTVTNFPLFRSGSYGLGFGTRKTDKPNYLRIYAGKILETGTTKSGFTTEQVAVIETHVDDVSGEVIGSIFEPLFGSGALDVTVFPSITKKNRPGWCIRVIARPDNTELLARDLIKYLRTLGVRFYLTDRYVLPRKTKTVNILLKGKEHEIRLKIAGKKGDLLFSKVEFEDLQAIAKIHDMSVQEVNEIITAQLIEQGVKSGGKSNEDQKNPRTG